MKITKQLSLVLIFALVCSCFLLGCNGKQNEEDDIVFEPISSSPAPEETAEPEGLEKLFGKESIKTLVVCEGTEEDNSVFAAGILAEATAMGIETEFLYTDSFSADIASENDADLIIGHVKSEFAGDIEIGKPLVVYDEYGSFGAGAKAIITADNSDAAKIAMEAALVYPPHDTPVRMLGMFESEMSSSFTEYGTYVSDGKFMDKGSYIEDSDSITKEEWIEGRLERYIEGMIDGFLAGNEELAVLAANALITRQRSDFEVFSCGLSGNVLEFMLSNPDILVHAAGVNDAEAGRAAMLFGVRALLGEAISDITIGAVGVNAMDLARDTDICGYMAKLADEKTAEFNTEDTIYLKENNK